MSDLAKIGFDADTTKLKDAKLTLQELGPAAQSAEKASAALTKSLDGAAGAAARGTTANNNLRAATIGETGAMVQAAAATNRAAAGNDNYAASAGKAATAARGLQGQVGNLSAQFGDIGVQLAGGQSPFQIALQQGLQLVGIFGSNGLGAVLRGLGSAFLSLLSPINLLTVGTIALGGYALQYFTQTGESSEKTNAALSAQQQLITSVASAWGEAVPAIKAYVDELERAANVENLRTFQQQQNLKSWDEIRSAMAAFISDNTQLIGVIEGSVDATGRSEGAINQLAAAWLNLQPKIQDGTATAEDFQTVLNLLPAAVKAGEGELDGFGSAFELLAGRIMNSIKALNSFNAAITQSLQTAGRIQTDIQNKSTALSQTFTDKDGSTQAIRNFIPGGAVPTPGVNPLRNESLNTEDLFGKPSRGGGGGGGSGAKQQVTELQELNQALQALNEPYAQATTAFNTLQTAMKNGVIDNDEYTASLDAIKQAFISSGGTSDQWAQIVSANSKKVSSSLDDAKGILKGFMSDFVGGLRQGKSIWESFADAATNALNKVIDKLLNNLIDAIFQVNSVAGSSTGGATGGGGGFLGGIFSLFTGLFSAKGNVFNNGVQAFAKGGSFTNSVVGRPTAFSYGNGASMGVMGEAGPEAVMPLVRGPDGSLGVQNHGGSTSNQNNITIAPVINVEGGSSGNAEQDQRQATKISDTVTDAIRAIVKDEVMQSTAYGGQLKPRGYGN